MKIDTDTGTRRVRHDVADGIRVMAFSLLASVTLTALIALGLGQL